MGLGDTLREPYLGISEKGSPEAPTKILIVLLNTVDRDKLIAINEFIKKEFDTDVLFKLEKEFLPISAFDWKELRYNHEVLLRTLKDRVSDIKEKFISVIFIGYVNLFDERQDNNDLFIVNMNLSEKEFLKIIGIKIGKRIGLGECELDCLMNPNSSSISLCDICRGKLKR